MSWEREREKKDRLMILQEMLWLYPGNELFSLISHSSLKQPCPCSIIRNIINSQIEALGKMSDLFSSLPHVLYLFGLVSSWSRKKFYLHISVRKYKSKWFTIWGILYFYIILINHVLKHKVQEKLPCSIYIVTFQLTEVCCILNPYDQ